MIVGSWGPYGFTLIYLSGVLPVPIDISPFGFIVSGVLYMWGIYQFDVLRLAPVVQRKVLAAMEDAFLLFDEEGALTGFNPAARRIVAGLASRLIGKPGVKVLIDYPALQAIVMDPAARTGRIQLGDGSANAAYYGATVTLVGGHPGMPGGKILVLRNVTVAVRAEERLMRQARELRELNALKDKMFSVLAHDIRDPLAVLINLMELMEEENDTVEGQSDEIIRQVG